MGADGNWVPPQSEYLIPFDGTFRIERARTRPANEPEEIEIEAERRKQTRAIRKLQRRLYASDHYAVLFIFQAMDAGGKDSTIRSVFTGVNPAGFQVSAFQQPSTKERDHDFLWRVVKELPERGRIGVFNRSHYEEVLIVRVHPELLETQNLPHYDLSTIWQERFESIRGLERHLATSGTVIVKFFLNLSYEEQRRRLLRRIDKPSKNWKFDPADLRERKRWPDYMNAFEDALNETSRPWAPWYAIPADSKPYMRLQVAQIVKKTLEGLGVEYPELDEEALAALAKCRERLEES